MRKTYPNAALPYVLRSRVRREDATNQVDLAAQVADGRCACGCGLPATVEGYHATCFAKHKAAVKTAFVGL